ncbi:uncharacterized protein L201_003213 [Kwoniella dendrophila CBS 6074]|uniref:Uncharacterized protein n=1 Tax=Kwoniella dendrophila CBS 6074 TaxID=1295534 RepID=A0AAX4JUT2_9TREE
MVTPDTPSISSDSLNYSGEIAQKFSALVNIKCQPAGYQRFSFNPIVPIRGSDLTEADTRSLEKFKEGSHYVEGSNDIFKYHPTCIIRPSRMNEPNSSLLSSGSNLPHILLFNSIEDEENDRDDGNEVLIGQSKLDDELTTQLRELGQDIQDSDNPETRRTNLSAYHVNRLGLDKRIASSNGEISIDVTFHVLGYRLDNNNALETEGARAEGAREILAITTCDSLLPESLNPADWQVVLSWYQISSDY